MNWLLAGLILAPTLHWIVRKAKFPGVRTIIALLVFAPGLCATTWLAFYYAFAFYALDRYSVVYTSLGRGALFRFAVVSVITATYLGVCLLLEHFPVRGRRDREDDAVRVVRTWRSLVAIQLALMAVTVYLYNYNTLGDAVTLDNLPMVEKRLNWNLEGLGPNNGLIVKVGSAGLELYSLLPVAVKNGNYDMVKLLVMHGADLNPKDWDEYTSLPSGMYFRNTLYFAAENQDYERIDFLIDLGVNPEQGIFPALREHDRKLLGYFLEKGASLEFAMGVAKRMNYSQQQIDEAFAEYTAKIRGEAGQ